MDVAELYKTHDIARERDIEAVFEEMCKGSASLFVRRINGGAIFPYTRWALGPYTLQADNDNLDRKYIVGRDAQDGQIKHLSIFDRGGVEGVVVLRYPGESWAVFDFEPVRIYIRKELRKK